ncbi:hypothetical protein MCHIJ_35190 [Mycolicibacterium chitae]|uniref:hypothetical protein n=1 Tax=Mycolicibacterium TaxID=1866885 RepID=UPI000F838351|nr:hypothetical protein [Mycolicibacterium chitae]MCV7106455.1 hypothetical protein [Mycolicibacterium chitae]BBZ04082.1 hypothetical protein MCHIJ_35190 [Mycolicibacterium chitae]
MSQPLSSVLSAATIFVAAFGLSGCSDDPGAEPRAPVTPTTTSAPAPAVAPLPDPAALTDVLARLSDPAIPGDAKLPLVEGATPDQAGALDGFAKALADNQLLPLSFTATELSWSEADPGNVWATVTATPAKPESGPLTFPMEFQPAGDGWQLTRETADLLLAFGG